MAMIERQVLAMRESERYDDAEDLEQALDDYRRNSLVDDLLEVAEQLVEEKRRDQWRV